MQQLVARLQALKQALLDRLLSGDGSVSDFSAFTLRASLADVDRLIGDATTAIVTDTERSYLQALHLGTQAADLPLAAAQLEITAVLPGVDAALVNAAFGTTLDLLTAPMQQFGRDIKIALRRAALAGDSQGQAIATLRDTIAGQGIDTAQYDAERIVRTELGRVFNEATYARLIDLAQEFPFIRKAWRATNDSRTRKGHTEASETYARGAGIPIADLYRVNVYQEKRKGGAVIGAKRLGTALLRFPLDPLAKPGGRIAAGATISCRCNAFVDFDMADFAEFTRVSVQHALGAA